MKFRNYKICKAIFIYAVRNDNMFSQIYLHDVRVCLASFVLTFAATEACQKFILTASRALSRTEQ